MPLIASPGPYWMAADRNSDDQMVYDVGAGEECLATFERREDALMYRASPDMLDALRAIRDDLVALGLSDFYRESAGIGLTGAFTEVLQAIAKAEGRA